MARYFLFTVYFLDLSWLFLCFVYSIVMFTLPFFNIKGNEFLPKRRALVAFLLAASWFYYIQSDAIFSFQWLRESDLIYDSQIWNKVFRESVSLFGSIANALLVVGYSFGGEKPKL